MSDGRIASAGGWPYGVTFWNLTSKTSISSTTTHSNYIFGLIQLKDTNTVVSASEDKTIKFWNSLTGILIKKITSTVNLFCLTAISSSLLAVGSYNSPFDVEVWNFETNTLKKSMSGHSSHVRALLLLPSGALATGAVDGTVKLWNMTTFTLIKTLSLAGVSNVYSLCWLNNGLLAVAGDYNLFFMNITTGNVVKTLSGHTSYVMTIMQLKNGLIASGSRDNSIKLWNANNGSLLKTLPSFHTNWVWILAETSTGQIVSGSWDKNIAIW